MRLKVPLFVAVFLLASHAGGGLQAYLDPGTGSVILQAVLGGVIGALALTKLYWQKLKGLVSRRGDSSPQALDE